MKIINKKEYFHEDRKGKRKIIFSHRRALGDVLQLTAGVRDFKLLFPDILINVDTPFPDLWLNNPYIDRSLKRSDPEVQFFKVGYPVIGNTNGSYIHFSNAFLLDMIAIADLHEKLPISLGAFCSTFANGTVGDPSISDKEKNSEAHEPFISLRDKYKTFCQKYSRQWPDIHLTEEEKNDNLIKEVYGIDKYFVVSPGGKSDCTCKIFPWYRFQRVIDYYEDKIKFVVIGRSDHIVEKLDNVIDLTDKFNKDIRRLIPLVYHAEGCVTGVSFLMHLAAAMPGKNGKGRKPCVSIYGGRENTGFTAYTGHQILHTNNSFSCCQPACWKSRTHPLLTKADRNKNLCRMPIQDSGHLIQACMNSITSDDVIRAIGKYFDGDVYTFLDNSRNVSMMKTLDLPLKNKLTHNHDGEDISTKNELVHCHEGLNIKEINLLGSLSSAGGGEQSLCMIAKLLKDAGWNINLYHFGSVHKNYKDVDLNLQEHSFNNGMAEHMKKDLPLLFYGNDSTTKFVEGGEKIVENSSQVIIGINYINRPLPKCRWLAQSGKVKAIIFQNNEKKDEFIRDQIGYENTRFISLFGAIDLEKFLKVCPGPREKDNDLVVLKHCTPDWRKYVSKEAEGRGEKIHVWQKNFDKENDIKFYTRLLKDIKGIRFEFMEAHKEIANAFKDEPRMVFHKWDSMLVEKFLERGHVYLYRTSNLWRDNYPRVLAEALAAGLPAIVEPRDGTKDRVRHGESGFFAVHFDEYALHLKTLKRKEKMRQAMGKYAKDWAKKNLDPREWVRIINVLTT